VTFPREFVEQRFTRLEMQGRHLRKVLRWLARLRRERGQSIGDPAAWTSVLAEVAAAVIGPTVTEKQIDAMCAAYVGFEPDKRELARAARKVRLARAGEGFAIMSSASIGRLVDFTAEERTVIAERLRLKRVFILPIDNDEERRRQKRASKTAARAARGATPRRLSKAALARELGVSRSTLYRRPDATLRATLPMRSTEIAESEAIAATVSATLPGACDSLGDTALRKDSAPETVALDVPGSGPALRKAS
jgi:hypothetical protein